jgi:hypothetical protein
VSRSLNATVPSNLVTARFGAFVSAAWVDGYFSGHKISQITLGPRIRSLGSLPTVSGGLIAFRPRREHLV